MTSSAGNGATPSGDVLLRVDEVTAGYGGGDILKQVTFDVPEGGITCIVGPNGAGKSTLVSTISGLLRLREGEIRFSGRAISGLSPRQILDLGIAQVPQAHSLFLNMTVRENVEMGAFTIDDNRIVRQRLEAVEETYPIVRERADEKAGSLSGGQQRLVEFARCMMLDPALIILDEPSMGLDPQVRKIVFDMVETMHRQGKTILLVEQNARAGLKLSSRGESRASGAPWKVISPWRGRNRPLIVASSVDLPAPLGPTMHVISFSGTSNETSLRMSPPP